MNFHLITIGDKMSARVRQGYDEYAKWCLPRECREAGGNLGRWLTRASVGGTHGAGWCIWAIAGNELGLRFFRFGPKRLRIDILWSEDCERMTREVEECSGGQLPT